VAAQVHLNFRREPTQAVAARQFRDKESRFGRLVLAGYCLQGLVGQPLFQRTWNYHCSLIRSR
jgi:hypothetical protein